MSKIEQLETFIKVVEYAGITKAAPIIHLSASAVTKQIQSLEMRIGVQLFDRVGRNLKLTEIGERYYLEAINALKNLQQLESLIKTSQKEISGILKVRSMQFVANQLIIPRLPDFLARYPKLQFSLENLEHMPNLWKDGVDVVYGVSLPGQDDWVQRKIGITDLIICASPIYLKQFGTPQTLVELKNHRYLTHAARNPDHLIRLHEQNLIVPPYLWFNNYESMIAAALVDLGFIWLHKSAVAEQLKQGQLIEIFPQYALRNQEMYLYYQNGQYIDPKIRVFVDFFSK